MASRDAGQLYAALDLETRWSWMSVRRAHREAYDIVLSNFPEGPAREQQLRRFEAGALAENEAALFAQVFPAARWDELGRGLPTNAAIEAVGEREARVTVPGTEAGSRTLSFRRGDDGSWGFAGLAAEAEAQKLRAGADLDLVRTNAADLERAATRAGR